MHQNVGSYQITWINQEIRNIENKHGEKWNLENQLEKEKN